MNIDIYSVTIDGEEDLARFFFKNRKNMGNITKASNERWNELSDDEKEKYKKSVKDALDLMASDVEAWIPDAYTTIGEVMQVTLNLLPVEVDSVT